MVSDPTTNPINGMHTLSLVFAINIMVGEFLTNVSFISATVTFICIFKNLGFQKGNIWTGEERSE